MNCAAVLRPLLASHVLLRLDGSGRVWIYLLKLDLGACPDVIPYTDSLWLIKRNLNIGSHLRSSRIELLIQDLVMVD